MTAALHTDLAALSAAARSRTAAFDTAEQALLTAAHTAATLP
jgi:hypothetical protein